MKDVLNLFSAWPCSEYHVKILAYLSLTMIVLKKKILIGKKPMCMYVLPKLRKYCCRFIIMTGFVTYREE